ncbi:hypothetical protein ACFPM7_23490 [Actinokineospora guangxiensis]|uniref:Preprotein translocase subunit SecA n=1 Tax=Actinokineospora guangxiensis TaxID=1490288 RepID=A0ABW0EV32_9PSEU
MSKQQRKRTAKRKKRERAARRVHTSVDQFPSTSVLLDSAVRLDSYLALSGDPAAVVPLARQRLDDAVEKIAAAVAHVDTFDVLEAVKLRASLVDPETYRESEHGATVAMIELTALILASRGARPGTTPPGDVEPNPSEVIGALQAHLQNLMDAGQVLNMFSVDRDDALHRISFGTRLREVAVRNSSYPHMVEDTLTALFDEPAVEAACRSVLGCTVSDIRTVFAVLQRLTADSWTNNLDALERLAGLADSGVTDLSASDLEQARRLLGRLAVGPGANAMHTPETLAAAVDLDVRTIATVLDLFSTPMSVRPPVDAVLEFFEGKSPFRTRPVLATPEGEYTVVHHALLVPAIRERVEDALRHDTDAWNIYSKHRGAYLEAEAARLITVHLPGCAQHLGFEYFVPARDTERHPASYTKLVEGDGLLLLDDIAIIIEAKAVALRPRSRTGDPLRLRQDLRRIVTDAADQGDRLRRRIFHDRGLRLRDETWLDLTTIREIHTVAVSLEDLSGIATITSELVTSGLLTTDDLPWTVSLHDLRIISELIDRPAELLLYLRRRTEPDTTRRFHAVDELDFFLHFLAAQLYVEPDPDEVHDALPQLGAPRTRDRRRHRRQGLELLTSLTDPLDAWYFHELGIRATPIDKPRMKANLAMLNLIDELAERRDSGWLALTATLLHLDESAQRHCATAGTRLAAQTRADGLPHSQAIPMGTRRGDSVLLVLMTTAPAISTKASQQRLREYTTAKKHQLQLDRGFGLLYDSKGRLISTFYDNRTPGPDPVLDALCSRIPLKGPEAFQGFPPHRRRTRSSRKRR